MKAHFMLLFHKKSLIICRIVLFYKIFAQKFAYVKKKKIPLPENQENLCYCFIF